jgi:cytochrome c
MNRTATLSLALLLAAGGSVAADKDDTMLKLASNAGCLTCHHIDPGAKGPDGKTPIGPAWKDVAAKYKGSKTAQADLTRTVLAGSNPYDSHWKGKVSGLAMPPNKVVLNEAEAKQLVKWILALPLAARG